MKKLILGMGGNYDSDKTLFLIVTHPLMRLEGALIAF